MSVIKFIRDIEQYFKYPSDDNPTTQQDYQNAVRNWVAAEGNLVDCVLWQPTTAYAVGNMVKTPSLPSQYCLICTTAGTSGTAEPSYSGASVGDSVTDGSVTWKIDGVLSLSGGTMIGNIIAPRLFVTRGVDDDFLVIMGGSDENSGAVIGLSGKDRDGNSAGQFSLYAKDGTNSKALIGRPDGTLTWDGHSIVHEQAKTKTNTSNLSSSTSYTEKAYLSLSAGTWLVCASVIFPSNATGMRGLSIIKGVAELLAGQTNPAIAAGGATNVSASCIAAFSANATVSAMVFQNSGSTLSNVKTTITAQKLSDYTSFSA